MVAAVPTTITRTIIAMATPNEVGSGRIVAPYFLARIFICLLGAGAIVWGVAVFPLFRQQAPLNGVAEELLRGHAFKSPTLSYEAAQIGAMERSSFCSPTALHSAVVIRVAILQEAIAAADHASINSAYTPLFNLARTALACSPTDSYVWLTLFWLDAGKNGLTPRNTDYLRLSYALGPNEGWIGFWRVQLALAMFKKLPKGLSDEAIDEFVKLVDTQFLYREAATIFARAPPDAQSRIAERLKTADPLPRQTFAKMLYDEGFNVTVPGVQQPTRPWQ